jgi:hypothetical protein
MHSTLTVMSLRIESARGRAVSIHRAAAKRNSRIDIFRLWIPYALCPGPNGLAAPVRTQPSTLHLVVSHKYAAVSLHPRALVLYAGDMAQSTDNRDRSNGGTPPGISRLTVPEAARALGISPEAVRNRLSRRTLNSVKEDGTVYVLLEADRLRHTDDTSDGTPRSADNRSRYTDDTSDDIPGDSDSLISAKDETIRVLSEQLEAERTASSELRRIVAGLVQRVPELEAAPEPRDIPMTSSDSAGKGDAPSDQQEPAQRRSWLHRFFFGP